MWPNGVLWRTEQPTPLLPPFKVGVLLFPICSSNIEWWGGGGKLHFSPLKSAKFSKRPFRADCFNPGVLTHLWVIDSGKAWGLEHNYLDVTAAQQ